MIATILVTCLSIVQSDEAFLPSRDFILTKSGAVGLLPPISVCDFAPERIAWSEDGNRLLIVRRNPKLSETHLLQNLNSGQGQRSIVIFDMKTRKSREVLVFPESQGAVADAAWFGNGRNFFLTTSTGTKDSAPDDVRSRLYIGDAISNRVNLVHSGLPGESISFCPSPKGEIGAMVVSRISGKEYLCWGKFANSSGQLGASIETPENAIFRFREESYWSEDAKAVALTFFVKKPVGASVLFMPFDAATGRQLPSAIQRPPSREKELEFAAYSAVDIRKNGDLSVEIHSVWLGSIQKGSRSKVYVGDGKQPQFSPARSGLFYISGGVGLVRPLVSISHEEFRRLLAEEEKNRLTVELQECIKVFKEWVLEENLEFPTPEEWAPKAKSWSSSRPEIVGFVYTFKGGQLPAGRQSQTIFGHKQGETGRATCYMDGRVVWKPN